MNHNFNGGGEILKRKSEANGDENSGIELKRPRFDDPSTKNGVERQAGENLSPISSVLGAGVPFFTEIGSWFRSSNLKNWFLVWICIWTACRYLSIIMSGFTGIICI